MLPNFYPGQKVILQKKWFFCNPKIGDVIILKYPRSNREIIKRIKKIRTNKKKFYVAGDNSKESTDSKTFGWVEEKNIIGKIIYKLQIGN